MPRKAITSRQIIARKKVRAKVRSKKRIARRVKLTVEEAETLRFHHHAVAHARHALAVSEQMYRDTSTGVRKKYLVGDNTRYRIDLGEPYLVEIIDG